MKRVLIVASVASMIDQFNMDNIRILKDIGCEVHVAANFDFGNTSSQNRVSKFRQELIDMDVVVFNILFPRSIGSLKSNSLVLFQLKKLINENNYCLIHAHSPIGGFLTRIASMKYRKNGLKVIYTAHGFHFFKGAPLLNWLLFFPIEFFLSFVTDTIITINKEDFEIAKKMYAKKVVRIPGVGIKTQSYKFSNLDVLDFKSEIGIPLDSFVMLSVGEITTRKNHQAIVRAISLINNERIHYLICGLGEQEVELKGIINGLGLTKQVHLLGYRTDINEIIKVADCFAFPSKREGLGIAAIEAMAAGLPIITSNINGIRDYSIDGITGFMCKPNDIHGFAKAIQTILNDEKLRNKMSLFNVEKSKEFDISKVHIIMKEVYLDNVM